MSAIGTVTWTDEPGVVIVVQDGIAVTLMFDATPAQGFPVTNWSEGVQVVHRDAPSRPGAIWAAPYAVNCMAHGWIVSRATREQATSEAEAHLAEAHAPSGGVA